MNLRFMTAAFLTLVSVASPLRAQENNTPVFDLAAVSCSFHVTFERVRDHAAEIALSIDLANPEVSQQCRELDRMWEFLFAVHEVSLASGDRFDWLLAAIIQEARGNIDRTHLVGLVTSEETSEQSYLERLSLRGRRYAMTFGASGEPRRALPPPPPPPPAPPGAPPATARFDIPMTCDNGERRTGSLTISDAWAEIDDLLLALAEPAVATGCAMPQDVRDTFVALFQIALQNDVSFANLARDAIAEASLPPRPDRPEVAHEVFDFLQWRFTTPVDCSVGRDRLAEVGFRLPHRSQIPGNPIEELLQDYEWRTGCSFDPRLMAVLAEILADAEARNVLFVDALHAAIDGVGPFADAIREIDFLPSYWRPHPVPMCRYPHDREFAVIGSYRGSVELEPGAVDRDNYEIVTNFEPLDTAVRSPYFDISSSRYREGGAWAIRYAGGLDAVSGIRLFGLGAEVVAQMAQDSEQGRLRLGITWQDRDGMVRETLFVSDQANSLDVVVLEQFNGTDGRFGLDIAQAALSGAGLTLRFYSDDRVLAETIYDGAELQALFSEVIEAVEELVAAAIRGPCRLTRLP